MKMVHALHQRLAPPGESTESRRHAEGLAARGADRAGGFALADFLTPSPALLAFPPQSYSPWSKVWIGHAGLIGEVVDAGVTVRIFMTYEELGIEHKPGFQGYECGEHDMPPIPDVVNKMKKVAQKTAEMNKKLPETATAQRVALVMIYGVDGHAYRSAGGQGLIVLGRNEFDAGNFESTILHEGSHAIFEFHSVRGSKDVSTRTPDPLALRIADLYAKLSATKDVPEPTAKFNKKSPPPLIVEESASTAKTYPAGTVMVMDVLWADSSGGHPWHAVDEFFVSAYGAFVQQPDLLREIIKYYEKA